MIEEDKILRIKTFTASSFSDLTKSELFKSFHVITTKNYKENDNYVYVNNKLDKIITDFKKSFSTAEVKEFVDKSKRNVNLIQLSLFTATKRKEVLPGDFHSEKDPE
uniref:Uncharacterized protein n=1 Tax=Rhizophagus irregularis (strain DAOM 181602 / DAOM 197198 / MUCL 43194) TaxID=747089 RepID=U9TPV3_RHIID